MAVVVDTNVALVANGTSEQASPNCVLACVQRLEQITKGAARLVLDDKWLIISEYKKKLRSSGQPGPGDAFLKWVLTNWANTERCDLVSITPEGATDNTFEEFPLDPDLADFDLSDRKFVAVASAHLQHPPILQAVDIKWWHFKDALKRNGVIVDFLCEEDIQNS